MKSRVKSDVRTVAFCGTRGVPANYGGFETAVDEISSRFVENSYESVVFCRRLMTPKLWPFQLSKGTGHRRAV